MADRHKGNFDYHFSMRAILSTLIGESADSILFFPLAFYVFPLVFTGKPMLSFDIMLDLMLTQVVAKTAYEILVLPLTIRVVKFVKKMEDTDIYDEGISYSAFKIKEI